MIQSRYSKRFEVANVGHVARVKNIDDSGLVALTQAKPYVEPILKNKKKAELIKAKMTGSSMEAIAKSAGSTVLQATDVIMENPQVWTRAKGCWNCICFGS
jgi:peptidyl-prolyl cis-trans isomerase D